MAGFDPAKVEFRLVTDLAWALLVEVYGQYGLKFEDAMEELNKRLTDPLAPEGKKARAPDNQSSMVMLEAMMSGSDFGGPRG